MPMGEQRPDDVGVAPMLGVGRQAGRQRAPRRRPGRDSPGAACRTATTAARRCAGPRRRPAP